MTKLQAMYHCHFQHRPNGKEHSSKCGRQGQQITLPCVRLPYRNRGDEHCCNSAARQHWGTPDLCPVAACPAGTEALEIVATAPVGAGSEIHNTYGHHGNTELVYKYGFGLRMNPFDEVTLDKASCLEAAGQLLGERALRRRFRLLNASRWG